MVFRGDRVVGASQEAVLRELGRKREILAWQRRRRSEYGARLALALVGREIVERVLDDRTTERGPDLLVRVRKHPLRDGVRRVEPVVAEIAVEAARRVVGAGPRDSLHLDADRAALRDVEEVGDDLELGDRLAAELRLAEPGAG